MKPWPLDDLRYSVFVCVNMWWLLENLQYLHIVNNNGLNSWETIKIKVSFFLFILFFVYFFTYSRFYYQSYHFYNIYIDETKYFVL